MTPKEIVWDVLDNCPTCSKDPSPQDIRELIKQMRKHIDVCVIPEGEIC